MKSIFVFYMVLLSAFSQVILMSAQGQSVSVKGAWETDKLGHRATMICTEKHFSVALFNQTNKQFIGTYGGAYQINGKEVTAMIEFHSMNPELIGTEVRTTVTINQDGLIVQDQFDSVPWKQVDDGSPGKLAGAWLITGRMNDGQMSKLTPGARRTMKILSGTRFQWIAYNVETKEFAGTGGGTYTTEGGKYTEHIEFFSRDNSRVGQTLSFGFSLEDGNWRHKGKSSKGDPIDEIWTRREQIGI